MAKIVGGNFLGTGWNFPVKVNERGNMNRSFFEQSIEQALQIILNTSKGERVMRPDFGCEINDLIFAPNNANTRNLICHYVEEALVRWEPRIILNKVEALSDEFDEAKINITIKYTVRSINSAFNMVYPFYLERGESDTASQFG